jgi:hypothetical protein
MRLTPDLKKFLGRECFYYSNKIGIKTPLLIYTKTELSKLKYAYKNDREKLKGNEFSQMGIAYYNYDGQPDRVFLNIRDHDKVGDLLDTLVHELVHIKYDTIGHNHNFQHIINEVMINR